MPNADFTDQLHAISTKIGLVIDEVHGLAKLLLADAERQQRAVETNTDKAGIRLNDHKIVFNRTNGISAGDGKFTVSSDGSMRATDVTIDGNLRVSGDITAFANLEPVKSGLTTEGKTMISGNVTPQIVGSLDGKEGSFAGSIYAESGSMGGWTMDSSKLRIGKLTQPTLDDTKLSLANLTDETVQMITRRVLEELYTTYNGAAVRVVANKPADRCTCILCASVSDQ